MMFFERLLMAHCGPYSLLILLILRFSGLVGGFLVVGMYGPIVNDARIQDSGEDPHYIFGVVAGGLGAILSVFLFLPLCRMYKFFVIEWIMFVIFIALFIIFGTKYIKEDWNGDYNVMKMKESVWMDLANAIVWFLSASVNTYCWIGARRSLKRGSASAGGGGGGDAEEGGKAS